MAVLLRHLASKHVRDEYLLLPPSYRLQILVQQKPDVEHEQRVHSALRLGPCHGPRWLVILRGPPGVGKTTTADALIRLLAPSSARVLYMDDNPPRPDLQTALRYQYVIAELFSGETHTLYPSSWVLRFVERGYRALSVRLDADFETVKKRFATDPDRPDKSLENCERFFRRFYNEPKLVKFAATPGVQEICVDANARSEDLIAADILRELRRRDNA